MSYDPQEIKRLRERWVRSGAEPCTTHMVEREYIPGIGRADYYCTVCGLMSPNREDFDPDSETKPFPPYPED